MKLSNRGIQLVKGFEGCELKPYKDQAGLWTVGIGHLIREGEVRREITESEALELFKTDVEIFEKGVTDALVKGGMPATQNQFDALVSLAFNIGLHNVRNSTLLKRIGEGDYLGAADQFLRWNKITVNGRKVASNGLTRRREAERALFLSKE